MALQLADRVQQLGSANTTVSFNLTSTPAGFQAFSPAITTGNTLYYTAYDGTNWEVGVGTLTSSSLLTRTTILSSSNAGAAVSTFGGTITVWLDYPSEKSVVVNDLGDVLINQSYDQGTGVLQVTGASSFNGAVVDKSLNLQGGNNLILQSQTFATANWYKGNNTVIDNNATAPDGTTTAALSTVAAVTGIVEVSTQLASATIPNSTTTTFSCYFKAGTKSTVTLSFALNAANQYVVAVYDLTAVTVSQTAQLGAFTFLNSAITSVGNNWYRCSITFSCTTFSSAVNLPFIGIAPAASGNTFNSSGRISGTYAGTETIYVWGAQLELGSVASAYTPTTTVAVTTTNNINVPSGQVLAGVGSASAPSYSFSGISNSGIRAFGNNLTFTALGTDAGTIAVNGAFNVISTGSYNIGSDISLTRDAANTLAQRNSTNAQAFRLYGTYTDASNYERLQFDYGQTIGGLYSISSLAAGTGTVRPIRITAGSYLQIAISSTVYTYGTSSFSAGDNAIDLGVASTGRFKNAYFSGVVTTNSDASINTVTVGLGGGAVSTNTAVGKNALLINSSGSSLVAVGGNALQNNSSGLASTAVGLSSMLFNSTGNGSTAVGGVSLQYNTTGNNHVAIGYAALQYNTAASNLVAVGYASLLNNTTNVATLGTITGGTGYTNGTYAGVVMTLSSGSTAITYPTATIVVAGGVVTTVTLTSNGVGFKDTTTVLTAPAASIGGTGSGFTVPVATLQSGTGNVAVGYQAGYTNSTGIQGTFNGYQAGYSNTTAIGSTFSGFQCGYSNLTGNYNSGYGVTALYSITSGVACSAYGVNSLVANSSGSRNVAYGAYSGWGAAGVNGNTTGSNNTYIGYQTVGSANNNTNEMVIGYQAVGLGSNTTVLGNTSTTLTQTYGVTKSTNYTVATLPSASTSGVGARSFVTDATATTFASIVAGGGSNPVPVYSDATNWRIG